MSGKNKQVKVVMGDFKPPNVEIWIGTPVRAIVLSFYDASARWLVIRWFRWIWFSVSGWEYKYIPEINDEEKLQDQDHAR